MISSSSVLVFIWKLKILGNYKYISDWSKHTDLVLCSNIISWGVPQHCLQLCLGDNKATGLQLTSLSQQQEEEDRRCCNFAVKSGLSAAAAAPDRWSTLLSSGGGGEATLLLLTSGLIKNWDNWQLKSPGYTLKYSWVPSESFNHFWFTWAEYLKEPQARWCTLLQYRETVGPYGCECARKLLTECPEDTADDRCGLPFYLSLSPLVLTPTKLPHC